MFNVESIRTVLRYSDWANGRLLEAATGLSSVQLDQRFEMGVGSLRRTLVHIHNGEFVWMNRWQGRAETKWPPADEPVEIAVLAERFRATWRDRDVSLATLRDDDLKRVTPYRDSKGSMFSVALGDMLFEACNHSIHHRAQAANMLRQLGAGLVELDYVMWLRQPA